MATRDSKRKPNWSSAETTCLVDTCTSQASTIEGKFGSKVSAEGKEKIWRDACEKINSIGLNQRTLEEVQKKWKDLKSQTKKKEQERRRHVTTTGGGEPSSNLSVWEEKIVSVIPSQSLVGIEGGVDIFQKKHQKDKTVMETRIGKEVLVHPADVHIEVQNEEIPDNSSSVDEKNEEGKDKSSKDSPTKTETKKRKPYDELVWQQIEYFKQAKRTSVAKKKFYEQATAFIKTIKLPEHLKQPCTEE